MIVTLKITSTKITPPNAPPTIAALANIVASSVLGGKFVDVVCVVSEVVGSVVGRPSVIASVIAAVCMCACVCV